MVKFVNWFKNLKDKSKLTFLKFDIVSFYPAINRQIFDKSLAWADEFCSITRDEIKVLKNSRESYLFKDDETWVKKQDGKFDVTMGAYDGAEVCELVGLFILNEIEKLIEQSDIGLYRDDGLAVVNMSGPQIEKLRKKLFNTFKKLGFSVTIEGNIKSTEFLDIWFDLENGTYKPYRKKNDIPVYINIHSNHPQSIKKQLPNMIQNRLSSLSSSREMFETEQTIYNDALHRAGYKTKLVYQNKTNRETGRKRHRNILWFNPPYSQSVKTNIGSKFLFLIDKHFKNSSLHKYFNRKTIKISYCCMPNMENIISNHNRKLMKTNTVSHSIKKCNCIDTNFCPLQGNCVQSSVVYKADVTTSTSTSTYIGLASNTFKERYNNHLSTLRYKHKENHTTLSKYIWQLKSEGIQYDIKWSIIGHAPAYNKVSKKCHLCLLEKTNIIMSRNSNSLNKRTEIMNKCRHREKHLLSSVGPAV